MMRDAKLSEGNSDKVVMWTGGHEYDDVIRALLLLDGPEIQLGTTFRTATPVYDAKPKAGAHPGANLSVSPFRLKKRSGQSKNTNVARKERPRSRGNGADTWCFLLGL